MLYKENAIKRSLIESYHLLFSYRFSLLISSGIELSNLLSSSEVTVTFDGRIHNMISTVVPIITSPTSITHIAITAIVPESYSTSVI